jgi:glycine amidinotransferase/scyllo-inosamine-4-phosphate amidinotransferase 1|tara:strand:+ start:1884 stop:3062 length:1179 start_codon:yes stop_codon:yes gene_type:complete
MSVNSHNEWDKLQEVIVGTAEGSAAVLSWSRPEPPSIELLREARNLSVNAFPQWFLDEIAEDLEGLCQAIRQYGALVHRPELHDVSKSYSSPFWTSTGNNIYNVRDLHLVVGNTVLETPSQHMSRYYEGSALYHVWYKHFDDGLRWISAPKPKLAEPVILPYFRDENERILTGEDIKHQELTGGRVEQLHKLSENEILFEAANTVRMGKDLLYLLSSSGNRKGAKWLQSVLGEEYRVHVTEDIYRSSHIDSTVLALRPGLVMLNSTRVNERNCPPIFDRWDKIWFEDVASTTEAELKFQKEVREPIAAELEQLGFMTNLRDMASPWVGMNFLSLDMETVLVDERQKKLIKVLEKQKITVVPVRMRHIYTQGGGIHCATLDTIRESTLENYFD